MEPEDPNSQVVEEQHPTVNSGDNTRRGRIENLKPWVPGQCGNPAGRPRRKPLTDAYSALLSEVNPNDPKGRTNAELIALALLKEALKGKVPAASEIADRIEGKVTQTVSGPDGGPVQVRTLSDFYSGNE